MTVFDIFFPIALQQDSSVGLRIWNVSFERHHIRSIWCVKRTQKNARLADNLSKARAWVSQGALYAPSISVDQLDFNVSSISIRMLEKSAPMFDAMVAKRMRFFSRPMASSISCALADRQAAYRLPFSDLQLPL